MVTGQQACNYKDDHHSNKLGDRLFGWTVGAANYARTENLTEDYNNLMGNNWK